jgi:hypothetical protein
MVIAADIAPTFLEPADESNQLANGFFVRLPAFFGAGEFCVT